MERLSLSDNGGFIMAPRRRFAPPAPTVPSYADDVSYLYDEIIPRSHSEVGDDWSPSYSEVDGVAPIQGNASQQAPEPEEVVGVPEVSEALDQMMSDSYQGSSSLDDYLESASDGQVAAEKPKSDPFYHEQKASSKSETPAPTEEEYYNRAVDDSRAGNIVQAIFRALGTAYGSDDYNRRNRNWGSEISGNAQRLYEQRRERRSAQRSADERRSAQRTATETRLGAEKQAAQLADPASTQSRRLQNAYALRFAQAVPDLDAAQAQSVLDGLAYSDEQTRSVVDDLLKSAQEARSQGRDLQAREFLAQLEAATSLQRSAIAADARTQAAQERRPRSGGGARQAAPITADWMLRREEELMALQGRNPYSTEERAARLAEIQNLQAAAARRDPAARSLWDKFAQTTEGEIRRLEAQGGTVDTTGIREHASGARQARGRISDEQAAEVAMAITGAARGGVEGWMQEHVGRALADTDDQDVINYSNHVASLRDTLAHREFGASQTNGEARRLAQRLGGLGFRPSAAALDTWVDEAERFLLQQRQRQTQERFRGTAVDSQSQPQEQRVRVRLQDGRTGTVPAGQIPEGATVIR